MMEYVSEFPENIMIYSRGRALITSSDEHVAHLMKAGRKCNKAAKVIRSATSHFAAAHTPHIGLWRDMMNHRSRTCPFTKDQGGFNGV